MNQAVPIISLLFSLVIITWLVVNMKFSSDPKNESPQQQLNVGYQPTKESKSAPVLQKRSTMYEDFQIALPNGNVLHSLMAGSGDTLILLIHGADRKAQNAKYWDPFFPTLSKFGRVVAVDMLGHGDSVPGVDAPTQVPPGQQADAIRVLLQSMKTLYPELDNLVIWGRSYGGRVFVDLMKNTTGNQGTILERLSKVILVAPTISGSLCTSLPEAVKQTPYLVFWAQEDPVSPSSRLWELKQVFPKIEDVVFKKKDFVDVPQDLSSSTWLLHTPELLLTDLVNDKVGHFLAADPTK